MHVSSRFTIAMHTLLCITHFGNSVKTTSDFIAGSVNVNPVVIRRTLGKLKKAGIVTVEPGVGGATLAKDAHDITMLDVFRAVDSLSGSLFGFHSNPNPKCPVGGNIHGLLDTKLDDAQHAMEANLATTTLADLNEQLNHKLSQAPQAQTSRKK